MEIITKLDYGINENIDARLLYPREIDIMGDEKSIKHIVDMFACKDKIIYQYNVLDLCHLKWY